MGHGELCDSKADPKQPLSLPIQNRRTRSVNLAPPEPQSLGMLNSVVVVVVVGQRMVG